MSHESGKAKQTGRQYGHQIERSNTARDCSRQDANPFASLISSNSISMGKDM